MHARTRLCHCRGHPGYVLHDIDGPTFSVGVPTMTDFIPTSDAYEASRGLLCPHPRIHEYTFVTPGGEICI